MPEVLSSPKIKKISVYRKVNRSYILGHPVPLRGALAIVATRDGDAVDAEVAETTVAEAYGKGVWS